MPLLFACVYFLYDILSFEGQRTAQKAEAGD
jgi:hypothetical protein